MARALLLIDIQRDYFPGGAYPLVGSDAAADLGFDVTVVGDGCAAPDLAYDGVAVPGEQVHAAFLAALADGYASVVKADSLT